MPSTTLEVTKKVAPTTPFWGWIVGPLGGVLLLAAAAFSVVSGPQVRATAEAAIDQENHTVCAKLGRGPETGRFVECAAALSEVRASYTRRTEQSFF